MHEPLIICLPSHERAASRDRLQKLPTLSIYLPTYLPLVMVGSSGVVEDLSSPAACGVVDRPVGVPAYAYVCMYGWMDAGCV